jgi:endonuclease/exonuclease/phosphatase family metal-dependent hydrolase
MRAVRRLHECGTRWLVVWAALGALACGSDSKDDAAQGDAAAPEPTSYNVLTFNVLCSFCGGGEYDPWATRMDYVKDILARHDPDLIGFQEVAFDSEIQDLLRVAPDYDAVYWQGDRVPWPDAMIFYRRSRFEVVERGEYWTSPTPDTAMSKGCSDQQVAVRLIVWATLRDLRRDDEVFFATTHFDNNPPCQEKSAELVMERTAPLVGTQPVIFTGDFNSQPSDTAYATLTNDAAARGFAFADSHDFAEAREIVTNQEPAPSYDESTRIDHIFAAGDGVAWTSPRWAVDMTLYGPNRLYPSDHFAIFAELDY